MFHWIVLSLATGAFAAPTGAVEFRDTVYPVMLKANCMGCHSDDGVASPTRLKFPDDKPTTEQINAFGKSLYVFVDRKEPAKSLLLNKPTMRIPHAGGKRIEPGSPDEAALREWVEYLAATPVDQLTPKRAAEAVKANGPIIRRLTHAQYNNTVRDLLNDQSHIADQFPPEDYVNGFRNQYLSQNTSPLLAENYAVAAEKLAKKAFLGGDTQNLIPCKPKSFDDAACRDRFLQAFGRRAFRRPLSQAETARYTRLFVKEAAASKQFINGALSVVEVMLQSPNFLMRAENGADPAIRPYETASKLSFFLWNSMPDDALLDAARSGDLNSIEGVERHTRRMLESPKAREAVDEFFAEWLRFDRLRGTVRDRRSQFTPELALSMTEETKRLASHLVWTNGNFMEFFSAPYTFVNADLARLYKLPEPKDDYEKVTLTAESQRAGVLSHGSFLTMTSKPGETSPTARGLFVREQFLCQDVPQPPPGVNVNLPPITKEKPMTQKERLSMHLSNSSCASCHQLIDPIGFGFEKFDAVGAYRPKLRLNILPGRAERNESPTTAELELDTTGSVAGLPNSAFSSPRELGIILAGTEQCQKCVAKQLFRYMAGRHENKADRLILDQSFRDFTKSGFRFQELIVALAKWSTFSPRSDGAKDGLKEGK